MSLMLEGRRKSVQPMAQRLDEPNEQSLQHFVANTPWARLSEPYEVEM